MTKLALPFFYVSLFHPLLAKPYMNFLGILSVLTTRSQYLLPR